MPLGQWTDPRYTLMERLCNVNLAPDPNSPNGNTAPLIANGRYSLNTPDSIWGSPPTGQTSEHEDWLLNTLSTFRYGGGPNSVLTPLTADITDSSGAVLNYGWGGTATSYAQFLTAVSLNVQNVNDASNRSLAIYPTASDFGLYGVILARLASVTLDLADSQSY